ncbi:hypothetical protein L208DRAFT_1235070, partial [Tricholoma matsutake]
DTLNGCLCREVVDHSNSPPKEVIECREKGCETHWYHLHCVGLEQQPQKWICDACDASGQTRGGKRAR